MKPNKNIEKGTISICFVHEALVCIDDRGLDANELLARAGISPELLPNPQARVPSTHYAQLWHLIAQALDDEFFGMDSHRMKAGSFTLLLHAVIQSTTLEQALRRALRFLRLVLDDLAGELQRDGDEARLVLLDVAAGSSEAPPPKRAFAYGTYLLMLHGLACWLIGRRIPLHRADFRCPEPVFSSEWRILFTPNLNFAQASSCIVFPAEYLAMGNIQNARTMKDFLRNAPANFLVKYKNSTSVSAKIRRLLREMPPADWPDFEALASRFHVSAATLRRRLDDEGQSYRMIMDDLRLDMAIDLLGNTQRSLADIAAELGFAESSAFHRAFRKWSGGRPGDYRVQPAG